MCTELKERVNEFFEYLDIVEISDSGKEFHPFGVTNCRVLLHDKVNNCLIRMRQLARRGNEMD